MHLTFNDVNHAFNSMIEGINDGTIPTIKTDSRNGPVIQIPEPVIITYLNPRQRVLFNPGRDCNPFFHVYESLWMLAGRNDVALLKFYASKIDQFSDDGKTFNGAYGYRWRQAYAGQEEQFGFDTENTWNVDKRIDQLSIIINHLKNNPNSRRVVLQMWNVEDDLLKIDPPNASKDVCCNTAVYFSIRTGDVLESGDGGASYLDMTVTNRSNDIVWGMFGANAVHFSFLQEYIACALGVEVGHYHQFSNNAHIYTESNSGFHPEKWLAYPLQNVTARYTPKLFEGDYKKFDAENKRFVEYFSYNAERKMEWESEFFVKVAGPMMHAFNMHKLKDREACDYWLERIQGEDWRKASAEWIERRRNSNAAKKKA